MQVQTRTMNTVIPLLLGPSGVIWSKAALDEDLLG